MTEQEQAKWQSAFERMPDELLEALAERLAPMLERRKSKRFVKPTRDEVAEYCAMRANAVNAEAFCDFYESNGWKVGKNPMKDWKSAVRTWEQREAYSAPPKQAGGNRDKADPFAEIARMKYERAVR